MTEKRENSLSQEDIKEARERALSAGPLPDAVRRELVNIWNKQSKLPKEQRSLLVSQLLPSGWVITHLVPLLCRYLARELREQDGEASLLVAKVLDEVADLITFDVPEAVQRLVELRPEGKGGRFAQKCQVNILRILDLGIVGLPLIASIYANTLGISDVSSSLICDGNLSVGDSVYEAKALGSTVSGELTEGDWYGSKNLWIPLEFLSPDDFDSLTIEGISTRRF